jgi:pyruvate formate lyase activating enzyme
MSEIKGCVHSTESFGSADGPGIRFLIFLQGCQMRCRYCHNPDTWKMDEGTMMTADEILTKALRCKSYWKNKGGITVSGGEALLQIDFLIDLFTKAKKQGINTCLDTSGNPFTREEPFFSKFEKLMEVTDLLLLDIKHIDDEMHKKLTGCTNKNILDLARYLSDINKPVWIRHVLVPGWTDNDEYLKKTREFIDTLNNVEKVEVLPYHTLGLFKWKELGLKNTLEDVDPPELDRIENAKEILGQSQIKLKSVSAEDGVICGQ